MAAEGASSIGAAAAGGGAGETQPVGSGELFPVGTEKLGALKSPVTPIGVAEGTGGATRVGSAVGGPVGAKLFGTDVEKIKLFFSDALILSGVGKDYDDKTVKNMLGLLGG